MASYYVIAKINMNSVQQEIEIINKLGLHARAAAKLVSTATAFKSHVDIEKQGHRINGKSIMGVMMLAAGKGSYITLYIDGEDADSCAQALVTLINNRFDEAE